MNKQEFIISNLKPYFLDPSTCGVGEDCTCMYLTEDGKMCVLGKNLTPKALERFKNSESRAERLLKINGEEILKEESRGILSYNEWEQMQKIHDYTTQVYFNYDNTIKCLDRLSSETCDLTELKDLAKIHFDFK